MNRSRKIMAVIMLLVLIFSVNAEVLYASHTHDKNNSDITANMEVYQDYKTDDKFEKATEIIELDAKNSLSGGILTEDGTALKVTKGNAIEFSVNVPESAAYNIALSFAPLDDITEYY